MEFFFSFFFSLNLFPLFLFDDIVGCCQCFERARFSGIDLTPIDIHLYLSCKVLHSIVLTDGGSYNFFFVKSRVLKLQVSIMIID